MNKRELERALSARSVKTAVRDPESRIPPSAQHRQAVPEPSICQADHEHEHAGDLCIEEHVEHQEHRSADGSGKSDEPSHRQAILGGDDLPLVLRGLSGEPREPMAMERRRRHQQDGRRSRAHQRHDVDLLLVSRWSGAILD